MSITNISIIFVSIAVIFAGAGLLTLLKLIKVLSVRVSMLERSVSEIRRYGT